MPKYPKDSSYYYPPSYPGYPNYNYHYHNPYYQNYYNYHPISPQYIQNTVPHSHYDNQTRQELQCTTREIVNVPTESRVPGLDYQLEVVQQPVRARMCGFGEKDRRPISPLPFVRLRISDETGPIDIHKIDPGFFVLQAIICDHRTNQEVSVVVQPSSTPSNPVCAENLVGERCASGKRLFNINGEEDIWFVFRDLSVRAEGIFHLKFTLLHLGWQGRVNTSPIPFNVIKSVCSQPFTVFTAKKFPGMIETTALSRCFVQQGNKIPTRRDRKNRSRSDEGNDSPKSHDDSSPVY